MQVDAARSKARASAPPAFRKRFALTAKEEEGEGYESVQSFDDLTRKSRKLRNNFEYETSRSRGLRVEQEQEKISISAAITITNNNAKGLEKVVQIIPGEGGLKDGSIGFIVD